MIRNDADRRRVLRFSNIEVVVALAIAGMVNMAMVMMAAITRLLSSLDQSCEAHERH